MALGAIVYLAKNLVEQPSEPIPKATGILLCRNFLLYRGDFCFRISMESFHDKFCRDLNAFRCARETAVRIPLRFHRFDGFIESFQLVWVNAAGQLADGLLVKTD